MILAQLLVAKTAKIQLKLIFAYVLFSNIEFKKFFFDFGFILGSNNCQKNQ